MLCFHCDNRADKPTTSGANQNVASDQRTQGNSPTEFEEKDKDILVGEELHTVRGEDRNGGTTTAVYYSTQGTDLERQGYERRLSRAQKTDSVLLEDNSFRVG